MGSLGDEELENLVIDYIESPILTISDHVEKSSKALITLQEILGTKGEMEKEIEDNIKLFIKKRRLKYEGDEEKKDVMKKIVSMLRSDGYDVSICKTSWDSSFDRLEGCRVFRCTRKYEYVDIMMTNDQNNSDHDVTKRVIIDLDFKSQFELAKMTKDYKDITQTLPKVFVATDKRLKRVVSLVCGEMKKSMEKEGMSRPPWRTKRYMQAKWLSENRKRVMSGSKRGSSSWSLFDVAEAEEDTISDGKKTTCCLPIF